MSSEIISATSPPSLSEIESAIKLIDVKKSDLKKAFDDLQANSSCLSSFSMSWSDLDAHFSMIQNSVTQRFRLLESREAGRRPVDAAPVFQLASCSTQPVSSKQGDPSALKTLTRQDRGDSVTESVANGLYNQLTQFNSEQPSTSNAVGLQHGGLVPVSSDSGSAVTRPELKEFCERMDGKGLRKYIYDHQKEREAIRMELSGALKCAPDPGAMILDAMEGFYEENLQSKGNKDPEFFGLRRVCVFLLEQLMEIGIIVSDEARQRGKKLALEWKGKVGMSKDNSLEALALLDLVAAYGLGAEIDKGELVAYFVIAARYRQVGMLCRSIGLGEKVHDLIQKLLDGGKQLLAVRIIFEFGLTEKFPPVPLLKDYLNETKKLAKQVCVDGKNSLKSQNEATAKETGALKAVIKVIEEHKLEAEYSKEGLQRRIEQLEKQQADRKRPPAAPAAPQQPAKKKKQAQGKQQKSDNKHPRTSAFVSGATSAVPAFQQSHLHSAGLVTDHSAAYMTSQAGRYGLATSIPAVAPYAGSSAYGLAAAPMGFSTNPNPAAPHLYPYDRLATYGGYGVPPQYHPSYHPQ
ncbi:Frigida-like protein [Corchorus capsularis]|uniref:FRIGIDA-like protein n=1 Tax=Corchorus capsularis TaxID=210143 RepID=A0A1R3IM75_COCAP|nr:Frigida-like protein [Corchorus capsularis]